MPDRVIRSSRAAPEVLVHLDGRMQHGGTPPPSTPEAIADTEGAADIVAEAQRAGEEILAHAAAEAAAVRAEGYRIGREAGYLDGVATARAELAEALTLVQAAGLGAREARDRILASSERDTVELVLAAVETVIGEEARSNADLVLRTVQRAIARLGGQNAVRIRVNPVDAQVVRASLAQRDGAALAWEVREDGAIGIGGCVIDTANGEVDARLDVQLDAVARVLRQAVPDAR